MQDALFDALRTHWRQSPDLVVRGPASLAAIQRLQNMADGALSWDFLAYLRFCDGFENSLDSEGFRLWPADAMERVSTYDHGKFASRGSD